MTAARIVLERLRSWKLWAGMVILAAIGAGGYFGFNAWTDSSSEEQAAQTQLVPVTLGDLVNDVSVTGTLTYTTRETVAFGQQGIVSDVAVSEGDTVSEGDVLAVLDAETVANLEKVIAQARIDVRNAEDALEDAQNPYTDAQIARAESDVANARLDLQNAEEDLSEFGVVSPDLIVQAHIDILNAQAQLESAAENMAALVTPTFQEVVRAQSRIVAAHTSLQDAEDALDELLNPDSEETADKVADYQAEIDSAEDSLIGAQYDLRTAESSADERIRLAGDDLDTAQGEYNEVFEKWLGMSAAPHYGESPETIFAAHGVDLVSLFEGSITSELRRQFKWGILQDDPETPWSEAVVMSWVALYPGEILVDCGGLEAGPRRACIADEFLDTYELVQEQTANYETVQTEENEKVREAAVALANAEDAVESRRQALDDYLAEANAEPEELDLESRNWAIETAKADLMDAEDALADLMQPNDLDIEKADREIELAQTRLADAEESLAILLEEADPVELLVKRAALRLAMETLAEAEATLEEYNTVDQLEIELREAEVVAARATLDTAIENLERATLRAPFDGMVVSVNIESGQQVNTNTQAIEIADPSIVEVSGSVDEIDVLFLQVGAQAAVTLEALGSQTLRGAVSSIANSGTSQQGVVTYPVTILVESSAADQLPEGLSATAQVIIREQTDSVLIPLQALYGSAQAPTVRVVNGEDIVDRQVTLGISDDFWVVVEDGLAEGETISMEVVGSGTTQFGGIGATFRAVGGFGGGPRGGGGGPGGRQ